MKSPHRQRPDEQASEPASKRPGQQPFHLADVAAAEHELEPRGVALLHHRLNARQDLVAIALAGGQQIRELVDNRQHLIALGQRVQRLQQRGHAAERRTHTKQRLEHCGEPIKLRRLSSAIRDQHHRRLTIGEAAKQP